MSNEAIASELGIGMSKGGGLWISRASGGSTSPSRARVC